MALEYAWQVILEDDDVLTHAEEFQKVEEAGELVIFDQKMFFGFKVGMRYNTTTYAAGVWASVSSIIFDNPDDEEDER